MAIDVHAHYVPRAVLDKLSSREQEFGISLLAEPPACQQCLAFSYGLKVRPFAFFPGLMQDEAERIDRFVRTGVDRQILSVWPDVFGYGLEREKGGRWHRLLNDCLAEVCQRHPARFSMLASCALQDPAGAARELERAIKTHGAVGGIVAANIDGTSLGDVDLDDFWSCAEALHAPIFIHPTQPVPVARTRHFALNA